MPPSIAEPQTAPLEQAAPPQVSQGGADRALCAAVILLAASLHRALLGSPVFPVNDAYITLHNAQVLHWGHDPNYPGTPALAGATSAVHLALVVLLISPCRRWSRCGRPCGWRRWPTPWASCASPASTTPRLCRPSCSSSSAWPTGRSPTN